MIYHPRTHVLLAFLLLVPISLLFAAVPPMISYQGKLMQPSGVAVPDGSHSMQFAIYDVPTGGTALWSETNPSVQVKGGLFSVLLGSVVNLPANIFDSADRWFGVTVGADPEMTPRQQIASTPFAFRAATAGTVDDGAITADKLADGAVTSAKYGMVGEIALYGGSSAPGGWLICNGSAVSRTTYSALFAAIGTAFGAGNGSTTFNLPNLQNAFPIGKSATRALGSTGGEASHTLTVAELPPHKHGLRYVANVFQAGTGRDGVQDVGTVTGSGTEYAGSGSPHNNIPPYQAVNYIIKY